jgi:hypothetical protein
MAKSGIRKGKDFVKNMEKLKKIYGGKIPKNLTLEEADKTLKKVTPIKKKSGGKVGRATTGDRSVQRRKKRTKQATESLKKVRDLAKRAKPMSQFVSQPEAVKMLKKNMKKSGGEDRLTQKNLEELRSIMKKKSGGEDRLTQKNLEELRSIMKKKSGGTAKKNKKKDPIVSKFKRVRDTILLAPEAVEIGKDILQNLPMSKGGIKKLKSKKASEMQAAPAKKASQMQAAPAKKASELPVPDSNKGAKPIPPENKGLKPMSKGGMKKLKPIPADNKGLPKLPKAVRNRMGYMKKGGSIKAPCKLGRNKPTKLL